MRTGLLALVGVVLLAAFAAAPSGHAQAAAPSGAAGGVPDLSGIWETTLRFQRDICGEPNCRALLKAKPEPSPDTSEAPEMLPWAEEQFKKAHAGVALTANPPEHVNPAWNGCRPEGPVTPMLGRAARIELRQFPDVVLFFYSTDHAVRRVYMDGRGHPPNSEAAWMGHSIGRYEGDALVIDTVGIKDQVWLDTEGHPHTDALRLTERIQRTSQNRLEIEITIDDPKTFKKPWKRKLVKGLQEPGPQLWDTSECEEILQMGTHYSSESPLKFQKEEVPPTSY